MPHAIIRGENGRRHEVDFGDAPVRVDIYPSEETIEIFAFMEAADESKRRGGAPVTLESVMTAARERIALPKE